MARTKMGEAPSYLLNAEYFAKIKTWLAEHENIKLKVELRKTSNDGLRVRLVYEDEYEKRLPITPLFQNWTEVFEHVHQVCPDLIGITVHFSLNLSRAWDAQTFTNFGKFSKLRELKVAGVAKFLSVPLLWKDDLKGLTKLELQCHDLQHVNVLDAFTGLKTLSLQHCANLIEVSDSLRYLRALIELNLNSCCELSKLPDVFDQLPCLKLLDLTECRKLPNLPPTIGQAPELKYLRLRYCGQLQELPETLGDLAKLQELTLFHCMKLRKLPSSLVKLSNLQSLDLEACEMLKELPPFGASMKNLKNLNVVDCSGLTKLPPSLSLCPALRNFEGGNNCSLEAEEQHIIDDGDDVEDVLEHLRTKLVDAADVERAEAARQSRKRRWEESSEEELEESEEDQEDEDDGGA